MRYAMLIYSKEEPMDQVAPEQLQEVMEAYNAFGAEGGQAGVILGGDALVETSRAKTVSLRAGERVVTDGPYA